ncbi:hypothetical protein A2Z33_03310 [Candidatus Gottesmanbacteria bacterium RBG_16_52_11]|uniref:EamA domain-containing protein n=1 Tax=Candidatus Gottesmanbacteria bacterium RBG_16_52_11 TaxID=1798374 RepID=A0A1F5YVB7_9BACT|nr:MAG: hypothetical protein A2Z33_03310 [Candidatus Gottesmanbacteria bacterium RBG_16_52_11]
MKRQISVLSAVTAFALWSTLGVFFNTAALPTAVYVSLGSLAGLAVLYGYLTVSGQKFSRIRITLPLIVLFLIGGIKGIVWFEALKHFPVANAMLIHNLAPVVAAALSPLVLKEKASASHIIAIITGFLGLSLLLRVNTNPSGLLTFGAVLALIAALCSGIQDVVQRSLIRSTPSSLQAFVFILGQGVGSLLLLSNVRLGFAWPDFLSILYFGIIGTAIPIMLLSAAFRGLKAFEVSILGYTEPALGALWAALFLRQSISPAVALGGVLVFLSGVTAVKEESG